jgi:hypothetical protein
MELSLARRRKMHILSVIVRFVVSLSAALSESLPSATSSDSLALRQPDSRI